VKKSNRQPLGTGGRLDCFLVAGSAKQIIASEKPFSGGDARRRKRLGPYLVLTNFGGPAMTTKTSLVRYFAIRTAAFVGLTAISTAVMALPYLA
jgi:hypothetical protein